MISASPIASGTFYFFTGFPRQPILGPARLDINSPVRARCIINLGRKGSGGECAAAVGDIVIRLLAGTGQAQGKRLRGIDGTGGTWSGWTLSIGHL